MRHETPLASSSAARAGATWLFEPLARTHRATRTVTVGSWHATRYDFVGR